MFCILIRSTKTKAWLNRLSRPGGVPMNGHYTAIRAKSKMYPVIKDLLAVFGEPGKTYTPNSRDPLQINSEKAMGMLLAAELPDYFMTTLDMMISKQKDKHVAAAYAELIGRGQKEPIFELTKKYELLKEMKVVV